MTATPVEYQAAEALAAVLMCELPDDWEGPRVEYHDRVANMVMVNINGMRFHAVMTAA